VELNHHIQFNKPQMQFTPSRSTAWFLLRYETWRRLQQHQQSRLKACWVAVLRSFRTIIYCGMNRLTGLRQESCWLMRGLGKTIEAGFDLHHRLINGLSNAVLIVVPERCCINGWWK